MKSLLYVIACAFLLSACAHSPAREKREVVTVKPEIVRVAEPVQKTRKAVESASIGIEAARKSADAARLIAAKTAEAAALEKQIDAIELSLTTTQAELTAALASVRESEVAISYLTSQVEAQYVELQTVTKERNQIAEEKRDAELAVESGKTRERILWKVVFGLGLLSAVLAAGLYLAIKPKFIL